MKHLAVALFTILSSLSCFSQDSEQYRTCTAKAKAQMELNECAGQEAARVDTKLNKLYGQLLSKVADDQNAVAKIKAAERAWIAYRDAYLEAMYPATDKQVEYGSIYPMDAPLLTAKLTQQHIADVRELLKQY